MYIYTVYYTHNILYTVFPLLTPLLGLLILGHQGVGELIRGRGCI